MVVNHGAWTHLRLGRVSYRVRSERGRDLVEQWAPSTDEPSPADDVNWTPVRDRATCAQVVAYLKRFAP